MDEMLIFAVESSCDETAVALYKTYKTCKANGDSRNGKLIGHKLYSQADIHSQFGGVVPELAARNHIEKLAPLTEACLQDTGIDKNQIDAIAYTMGPGLIPCLMAGASYARALAYGLGIRALGIHHLEGHLLSPLLAEDPKNRPDFPYVALLVSGGHTQLYLVRDYGEYELAGQTLDDSCGEAFDKVAAMLGLGYPGGAELEKLALQGDAAKHKLSMPLGKSANSRKRDDSYNFSFSGIKTQVRYLVEDLARENGEVNREESRKKNREGNGDTSADRNADNNKGESTNKSVVDNAEKNGGLSEEERADIAASFQHTIVEGILDKIYSFTAYKQVPRIAIVGGVSANSHLRSETQKRKVAGNEMDEGLSLQVFYAPLEFCTDNAAMIALTAAYQLQRGQQDNLGIRAKARMPMIGG